MSKRSKFVITTSFLTVGFILLNNFTFIPRIWSITLLSLATLIMFRWALAETITGAGTFLVLILPSLFTLGVGLFWFLLPASLWARLPVLIAYTIGIYVLFLTMNIFAVSTNRAIALSRAAKGVAFVVTLFTAFLLFDAILSAKIPLLLSVLSIFIISFLLFMQGLWTGKLTKTITRDMPVFSAIYAYCVAMISLLLYFWPMTLITVSIFLTASIYTLLGLGQAKQEGRLFRETIRDYLSIAALIFILSLLFTHWR